MLTAPHILLAAVLLTGRAVFILARPIRRCSWCRGTLRAKRHRWWGKVSGCRRCRARGRHARLGAAMVHGFFWTVAGDRIRSRLKDRIARVKESR